MKMTSCSRWLLRAILVLLLAATSAGAAVQFDCDEQSMDAPLFNVKSPSFPQFFARNCSIVGWLTITVNENSPNWDVWLTDETTISGHPSSTTPIKPGWGIEITGGGRTSAGVPQEFTNFSLRVDSSCNLNGAVIKVDNGLTGTFQNSIFNISPRNGTLDAVVLFSTGLNFVNSTILLSDVSLVGASFTYVVFEDHSRISFANCSIRRTISFKSCVFKQEAILSFTQGVRASTDDGDVGISLDRSIFQLRSLLLVRDCVIGSPWSLGSPGHSLKLPESISGGSLAVFATSNFSGDFSGNLKFPGSNGSIAFLHSNMRETPCNVLISGASSVSIPSSSFSISGMTLHHRADTTSRNLNGGDPDSDYHSWFSPGSVMDRGKVSRHLLRYYQNGGSAGSGAIASLLADTIATAAGVGGRGAAGGTAGEPGDTDDVGFVRIPPRLLFHSLSISNAALDLRGVPDLLLFSTALRNKSTILMGGRVSDDGNALQRLQSFRGSQIRAMEDSVLVFSNAEYERGISFDYYSFKNSSMCVQNVSVGGDFSLDSDRYLDGGFEGIGSSLAVSDSLFLGNLALGVYSGRAEVIVSQSNFTNGRAYITKALDGDAQVTLAEVYFGNHFVNAVIGRVFRAFSLESTGRFQINGLHLSNNANPFTAPSPSSSSSSRVSVLAKDSHIVLPPDMLFLTSNITNSCLDFHPRRWLESEESSGRDHASPNAQTFSGVTHFSFSLGIVSNSTLTFGGDDVIRIALGSMKFVSGSKVIIEDTTPAKRNLEHVSAYGSEFENSSLIFTNVFLVQDLSLGTGSRQAVFRGEKALFLLRNSTFASDKGDVSVRFGSSKFTDQARIVLLDVLFSETSDIFNGPRMPERGITVIISNVTFLGPPSEGDGAPRATVIDVVLRNITSWSMSQKRFVVSGLKLVNEVFALTPNDDGSTGGGRAVSLPRDIGIHTVEATNSFLDLRRTIDPAEADFALSVSACRFTNSTLLIGGHPNRRVGQLLHFKRVLFNSLWLFDGSSVVIADATYVAAITFIGEFFATNSSIWVINVTGASLELHRYTGDASFLGPAASLQIVDSSFTGASSTLSVYATLKLIDGASVLLRRSTFHSSVGFSQPRFFGDESAIIFRVIGCVFHDQLYVTLHSSIYEVRNSSFLKAAQNQLRIEPAAKEKLESVAIIGCRLQSNAAVSFDTSLVTSTVHFTWSCNSYTTGSSVMAAPSPLSSIPCNLLSATYYRCAADPASSIHPIGESASEESSHILPADICSPFVVPCTAQAQIFESSRPTPVDPTEEVTRILSSLQQEAETCGTEGWPLVINLTS